MISTTKGMRHFLHMSSRTMKKLMTGTLYFVFIDTINSDITYKSIAAIRKSNYLVVHDYKQQLLDVLNIVSEFIPGITSKTAFKLPIPGDNIKKNLEEWEKIISLLNQGNDVVFLEPFAPTMYYTLDYVEGLLADYSDIQIQVLGSPLEVIQLIRIKDEEYFHLLQCAESYNWDVKQLSISPDQEDLIAFTDKKTDTCFHIISQRDPEALLSNLMDDFESLSPEESLPDKDRELILSLSEKLKSELEKFRAQKDALEEILDSGNDSSDIMEDIFKLFS